MRIRSFPIVTTAVMCVVVLAVVFFVVSRVLPDGVVAGSDGPGGATRPSAQATPIHHYGSESGVITATLISPDNVSIQIVQIVKGPKEWLFHIHAHNNARAAVAILSPATNHYFTLALKGIPGTPYTFSQLTVNLVPSARTDLAQHPELPSTVMPSADADGWLVAGLSHTPFSPVQLMYVYGTVTAPACANPGDQSTCHPSTGYRVLVWNL